MVSGYDIAGVQLVLVYDYRDGRVPVLGGRIAGRDVPGPDPMRFLARVVGLRALPAEIFPVLQQQRAGQETAFPQLIYSARMFGVLAPRLALDLLAGPSARASSWMFMTCPARPAPGGKRGGGAWGRPPG